ncbi:MULTISPECIES: hypothetical protein [Laceyella]|jgi:hypothetical protein|uniref:Uncharacterized protein n=2 Tax=Laceyella TaxID=292635 RepID=A0AA46AFP9_9BACL|nr:MULTISPECIES: hypothetical protein [Laceyella]TCW41318.1 hypothetical protein EDC32_101980 [Laceyella sacchari]UWE04893.1 hypothetical protein NYR52_07180 [Laceyella sacchari]SMP20979.1 hypothetical protein SAMN06265361_103452 [Laceyella tengchongensis]
MREQHPEQKVIELEEVILVINGSPTPEACKDFVKLVQQMKVAQKNRN